MFDHNGAKIEYYRGVAQVVEHRIWDAGAASSNLVTPTISSVHNGFEL